MSLLIPDPSAALDFDHEVVVEPHYSEHGKELIRRANGGLIFDLGSGNNLSREPIKMDIFPLPNVDIVGVTENLPFANEYFHRVWDSGKRGMKWRIKHVFGR